MFSCYENIEFTRPRGARPLSSLRDFISFSFQLTRPRGARPYILYIRNHTLLRADIYGTNYTVLFIFYSYSTFFSLRTHPENNIIYGSHFKLLTHPLDHMSPWLQNVQLFFASYFQDNKSSNYHFFHQLA